jgi:antitoxin (DNA-binding transcriptional repressor) of toxin-antitoxin stability system
MNRRYTVAQVRERLADALDEAERGVPVIIERHGVRYALTKIARTPTAGRRRRPRIEVLDDTVSDGQWSWNWSPKGLKFRATRSR